MIVKDKEGGCKIIVKDWEIRNVEILDRESLCGALIEVTHILDEISEYLDELDPGMGASIFEISTTLDMERKNIEESINND